MSFLPKPLSRPAGQGRGPLMSHCASLRWLSSSLWPTCPHPDAGLSRHDSRSRCPQMQTWSWCSPAEPTGPRCCRTKVKFFARTGPSLGPQPLPLIIPTRRGLLSPPPSTPSALAHAAPLPRGGHMAWPAQRSLCLHWFCAIHNSLPFILQSVLLWATSDGATLRLPSFFTWPTSAHPP